MAGSVDLRTEQKVVGRGEGSGRGEEGFSSPPPGERGIGEGRGVKADNVGHSAGSWGGGGGAHYRKQRSDAPRPRPPSSSGGRILGPGRG